MSQFLSWGKYPYFPQIAKSIYWPEEITSSIKDINNTGINTLLPYGKGRSYGDSCLADSDHVLNMEGMNRILSFNSKTGVISVQAGLTIKELISITLPLGWFMPVTPGTKYITLGGAVANDIHGKNHHIVGTFGQYIKKIVLFRSNEGVIECSMSVQKNLFQATIGGLGLTGIILSIDFQLKKISSNSIQQNVIKFNSLEEYFNLSESKKIEDEYEVAWIDCITKGKYRGRGHFISGKHCNHGSLNVAEDNKLKIPLTPPFSLINSFSLSIFNEIYFHKQYKKNISSLINYNKFFYPLDFLGNWNNLYGKCGFQQYQCVIPKQDQKKVLTNIMEEISQTNTGSFLAVLKKFGNIKSPGLLSFPMEGVSLALDFPQKSIENKKLFLRLDSLLNEVGGRLYPAKDAHMSAKYFKEAYPDWYKVEKLRDSKLLSKFWKRVVS